MLVGVIAGVLLDVVAFLVARHGPQADSWSFRGNGALVVPLGLVPAKASRAQSRALPGYIGAGAAFTVLSAVTFYAAGLVLAPGS